jgi:hypothetical protein
VWWLIARITVNRLIKLKAINNSEESLGHKAKKRPKAIVIGYHWQVYWWLQPCQRQTPHRIFFRFPFALI